MARKTACGHEEEPDPPEEHEPDDADGFRPSETVEQLHRAMGGDIPAQLQLFPRVSRDLEQRVRKHAIWRSVKSKVEAQDIIHEIYQRALVSGRLAEFEDRGKGSLLRFLGTILDHTMVDTRRRLTTLRRGGGVSTQEVERCRETTAARHLPPRPRTETPTGHARNSERCRRIRELLPEDEHEAWLLCEVRDMTSEEAARILGRTPSSVRGLLYRARRRIQDELD